MRRTLLRILKTASVLASLGIGVGLASGRPAPEEFHGPGVPGAFQPVSPASRIPPPGRTVHAPDYKYFGGTVWAADSARWEAIEDSVWTFDTGAGSHFVHGETGKNPAFHASMEGWTGGTSTSAQEFRRLSVADFAGAPDTCVGAPAGLGGDYSLFAGFLVAETEARCWASSGGYGHSWIIQAEKTFAYDGAGSLLLEFDYIVNTEQDFDFLHVVVDTSCSPDGSGEVEIARLDGFDSARFSAVVTEGAALPSGAGCIRILMRFTSDEGYDSEDGGGDFPCPFAMDDVLVTDVAWGGSVNDLSDFESGMDGWEIEDFVGAGDYSRLEHLDDLPGFPEPDCPLEDSVLAFFDPQTGRFAENLHNLAFSPWIDLKAAAVADWPEKTLEFDVMADATLSEFAFGYVAFEIYPDTCQHSGRIVTSTVSDGFVLYFGPEPTCGTFKRTYSDVLPPGTEQIRIGLGVVTQCPFGYHPCPDHDAVIHYDNVRLRVGDFGALQDVVDGAADGDTVLVPPGDHSSPVPLALGGKNLVLLSMDGPQATTVGPVVLGPGQDSTTVLVGLSLVGPEGALRVEGASSPRIEGCRFFDVDSDTGAAVRVISGSVSLADCSFDRCTATGPGGAVFVQSGAWAGITGSRFHANRASRGGGVFALGDVILDDCVFERNLAEQSGGAIWYYADLAAAACSFVENGADTGQGGAVFGVKATGDVGNPGGRGVFTDCTFRNNRAAGAGGAVSDWAPTVSGCTFENNHASDGGALEVGLAAGPFSSPALSGISGSTFRNNSATADGGAVFKQDFVRLIDCTIQDNTANRGGGVFTLFGDPGFAPDSLLLITNNRAATAGGGVYCGYPDIPGPWYGSLTRSTVSRNEAPLGAGVYAAASTELDLDRTVVWGNCEDDLWSADGSSPATVTLTCSLLDTSAVGGGGSVVSDGPQVHEDPLFCAAGFCGPGSLGDFGLAPNSPARAGNNACGVLIGASEGTCATLGVPGEVAAPVLRAYPNPFRESITLEFAADAGDAARVEIFDVAGRLVNRFEVPALALVAWPGTDGSGRNIAPGVYFLRYRIGTRSHVKRIVKLP